MRDFKFRAWNKKHKKMWSYFIVLPNHKDIELMQYTGLKDRCGVEIYEGDIIQFYDSEGEYYFTAIVEWSDDYACYLPCGLHNGRIVGNVYETPELLKED